MDALLCQSCKARYCWFRCFRFVKRNGTEFIVTKRDVNEMMENSGLFFPLVSGVLKRFSIDEERNRRFHDDECPYKLEHDMSAYSSEGGFVDFLMNHTPYLSMVLSLFLKDRRFDDLDRYNGVISFAGVVIGFLLLGWIFANGLEIISWLDAHHLLEWLPPVEEMTR